MQKLPTPMGNNKPPSSLVAPAAAGRAVRSHHSPKPSPALNLAWIPSDLKQHQRSLRTQAPAPMERGHQQVQVCSHPLTLGGGINTPVELLCSECGPWLGTPPCPDSSP